MVITAQKNDNKNLQRILKCTFYTWITADTGAWTRQATRNEKVKKCCLPVISPVLAQYSPRINAKPGFSLARTSVFARTTMLAFTRLCLREKPLTCIFGATRNYSRYGGLDPAKADTVRLNTLAPAKGATHKFQRVGRGIGSGRGKTSTRGHKGQRAHNTVAPGFEGGQTPLFRRMRKFGFKNKFARTYTPLNLDTLSKFLTEKRIDITKPITMRTLKDVGVLKGIKTGVKLLARGSEDVSITVPLHLEVSQASKKAKEIIEAAGGTFMPSPAIFSPLIIHAI